MAEPETPRSRAPGETTSRKLGGGKRRDERGGDAAGDSGDRPDPGALRTEYQPNSHPGERKRWDARGVLLGGGPPRHMLQLRVAQVLALGEIGRRGFQVVQRDVAV